MTRTSVTPEQIDAVLPQTQCGLCEYPGCMPYATAIVHEGAAIDLCPPGGVVGLKKIAALVGEDAAPFVAGMEQKAKPTMLAVVREAECIGCTKCIQACPVDAILGSAKQMHTVINDVCTGCELCVAPCPVDCIDMIVMAEKSEHEKAQAANIARVRYQQHQVRLVEQTKVTQVLPNKNVLSQENKKAFIEAALLRVKGKKL